MKRILLTSAALLGVAAIATPASAWTKHTHYCNCGHTSGASMCGSSTSSSTTTGGTTTGGTTTTSTTGGTTTGGTTTTTGGTTTGGTTTGGTTTGGTTTSGGSTGGTPVPEPGMLGMMGLGFVGLALARRRRS